MKEKEQQIEAARGTAASEYNVQGSDDPLDGYLFPSAVFHFAGLIVR